KAPDFCAKPGIANKTADARREPQRFAIGMIHLDETSARTAQILLMEAESQAEAQSPPCAEFPDIQRRKWPRQSGAHFSGISLCAELNSRASPQGSPGVAVSQTRGGRPLSSFLCGRAGRDRDRASLRRWSKTS